MAEDLTLEVLKQIRDGIRSLNDRVEETNQHLVGVDGRLEKVEGGLAGVNGRLEKVETRFERVESGLNDLGKFMRQIALDQARHERFHHQHVEVLEGDVQDLKQRVSRLEEQPTRP